MSENRMRVMPIDAFGLGRFSVYENNPVFDFDLSETNILFNDLVAAPKVKSVYFRFFIGPKPGRINREIYFDRVSVIFSAACLSISRSNYILAVAVVFSAFI